MFLDGKRNSICHSMKKNMLLPNLIIIDRQVMVVVLGDGFAHVCSRKTMVGLNIQLVDSITIIHF